LMSRIKSDQTSLAPLLLSLLGARIHDLEIGDHDS